MNSSVIHSLVASKALAELNLHFDEPKRGAELHTKQTYITCTQTGRRGASCMVTKNTQRYAYMNIGGEFGGDTNGEGEHRH